MNERVHDGVISPDFPVPTRDDSPVIAGCTDRFLEVIEQQLIFHSQLRVPITVMGHLHSPPFLRRMICLRGE